MKAHAHHWTLGLTPRPETAPACPALMFRLQPPLQARVRVQVGGPHSSVATGSTTVLTWLIPDGGHSFLVERKGHVSAVFYNLSYHLSEPGECFSEFSLLFFCQHWTPVPVL